MRAGDALIRGQLRRRVLDRDADHGDRLIPTDKPRGLGGPGKWAGDRLNRGVLFVAIDGLLDRSEELLIGDLLPLWSAECNRVGPVCRLWPAVLEKVGRPLAPGAVQGQIVGGIPSDQRGQGEQACCDKDPGDDHQETVTRRERPEAVEEWSDGKDNNGRRPPRLSRSSYR